MSETSTELRQERIGVGFFGSHAPAPRFRIFCCPETGSRCCRVRLAWWFACRGPTGYHRSAKQSVPGTGRDRHFLGLPNWGRSVCLPVALRWDGHAGSHGQDTLACQSPAQPVRRLFRNHFQCLRVRHKPGGAAQSLCGHAAQIGFYRNQNQRLYQFELRGRDDSAFCAIL
jgi:hypothetical protein